jgi:hypothetical protein
LDKKRPAITGRLGETCDETENHDAVFRRFVDRSCTVLRSRLSKKRASRVRYLLCLRKPDDYRCRPAKGGIDDFTGITRNVKGEGPFHDMSVRCLMHWTLIGEKWDGDGSCVETDRDGDNVFTTFDDQAH